jgi:tetratricopeptide (TPR) repeat protein
LINSLIESETLVRENGNWKITKQIAEADISSSIHALISGRLDRLEKETKRILQEASVIGRSFLFEILKKITELKDSIDGELRVLERLDLIRTRSLQPDLEYMFKHPLTQEVVYNGLLKKERQEIHEQIGLIMEQLFHDRLPELYETLAFHFSRCQSVNKAVDYLVKAGEKCLARFTVEEAHQYFRQAYEILAPKENKSEAEKVILIDLLNSWGYAYYYRGDFKEFINLLTSYKDVAESLDDQARVGMFYAWFGIAIWMAGKTKDAYEYLCKARELGEKSDSQKVVGYACTWLTWACWELGRYAEGIESGERAQKIAESFPSDQYLFFKSLGALCVIRLEKGETKKAFKDTRRLLEYGEKTSNNTSTVFGYCWSSWGYLFTGDLEAALKCGEKALEVALDPLYSEFPKFLIAYTHLLDGQLQEAEDLLRSLLNFCEPRAFGELSVSLYLILAPVLIAKGQMKRGLRMLEDAQRALIKNQRRRLYAMSEHILGYVYSQIATGPTPAFSIMAKNIGFLVKNVPFAGKKAEEHLNKAIELFREIGANGKLGAVYLDLGLFYKARKKNQQARGCISEAIRFFEECEADVFLKQAKEVFESLG